MTMARSMSGRLARSTGFAAAGGVLLIVFALAIGILLLARALDDDGSSVEAGASSKTTTSASREPRTTPPPSRRPRPRPRRRRSRRPTPAGQVPVLVLNGRAVQGAAGANKEALLAQGYNALAPTITRRGRQVTGVLRRRQVADRCHRHRAIAQRHQHPGGLAPRRLHLRHQGRQGRRRPGRGRPRSEAVLTAAARGGPGRARRRSGRRAVDTGAVRRLRRLAVAHRARPGRPDRPPARWRRSPRWLLAADGGGALRPAARLPRPLFPPVVGRPGSTASSSGSTARSARARCGRGTGGGGRGAAAVQRSCRRRCGSRTRACR